MPKVLSFEADIKGGALVRTRLVAPVLAADPSGGALTEGSFWFNSTDDVFRFYDGTTIQTFGTAGALDEDAVEDIVAGLLPDTTEFDWTYDDTAGTLTLAVKAGGIANDRLATNPLARANHTGTQGSATISDFDEAVRDAIGAALVAGNNIDVTVDDVANTITIDVEALTSADITNFNTAVTGIVTKTYVDDLDVDASTLGGATPANLRDRATHTGTQTAATISDFATAVDALAIDADTLNGSTAADIQTAVTSAIVDAAPGTLDTLNELAAALGDDPNFATTITNAIGVRSRNFAAALAGGAASEVVTHNLNTRDLVAQVYVASGNFEEEDYIIQRTGVNTVTVVSEGGNIPAGRRIVIHAVGA